MTTTMKFTKLEKGKIEFSGIDNWNGKQISGVIVYKPYDVKLSQVWQVRFYDNNGSLENSIAEFYAATAKQCKQWLTN